jgi:hypothetical protein
MQPPQKSYDGAFPCSLGKSDRHAPSKRSPKGRACQDLDWPGDDDQVEFEHLRDDQVPQDPLRECDAPRRDRSRWYVKGK